MGRIKSTLIKRTAKTILKENSNTSDNFKENKNLLDENYVMPDKGTRNKVAGYLVRLKRAGNVPKPRKAVE